MDSLEDIIRDASTSIDRNVLATIIRIDGSAYRKEGTMMLLSEDGSQMGMISGGCLEEDLEEKAMMLLENPETRAQTMIYDMQSEDDLGWGRGAGCNGIVHILIEKVDKILQTQLQQIHTHLKSGSTIHLFKEMIPIETAYHGKQLEYNVKNVLVHTKVIPNQSEIANMSFSKDKSKGKTSDKKPSHQPIFTQTIQPKPRLFIFGAGMDARPLVTFAQQTGFNVTIWDWRQSLLKQSLLPDATLIHTISIKEAIIKTGIMKGDYAIIMTHDFQKDKEMLDYMLRIDELHYLGILGPRRRTKRLIQDSKLKGRKLSRSLPDYIHSPVGLPIGADGPDEIAISILAELIVAKQGKSQEMGTTIENNRNIFSSWK